MPSIVLIGAGFSGTMLSVNLHRVGSPDLEITLIDRRGFARGLAYSTANDSHLLNVPAGKMSAFPDLPSHFLDWLRSNRALPAASDGTHLHDGTFVPRRLYGLYLETLLADSRRHRGARQRQPHSDPASDRRSIILLD